MFDHERIRMIFYRSSSGEEKLKSCIVRDATSTCTRDHKKILKRSCL